MNAIQETIAALLAKYNDALNASSTDAVMPLYSEDGVFMPPYSPSAIGSEAVRKTYDAVFKAITLDVKFSIAEIAPPGCDRGSIQKESSNQAPKSGKTRYQRRAGTI